MNKGFGYGLRPKAQGPITLGVPSGPTGAATREGLGRTARLKGVTTMPTGKVKWYDVEKGFGFIASEEGEDVFVHTSALPAGVPSLKPRTRVEFGVAEGRRGIQAMSLRILDPLPSVAKGLRKPADDLAVIVEDLIKLLDNVGGSLRRGKYPDERTATKVAAVLRAVADDLDA